MTAVSDETLTIIDRWWRTANYLSVGQIYLLNNPLLRTPLSRDDVKPRLLGHWGTTPGLTFLYAHLNRVIKERQQSTLYITGPGHGGPGLVAGAYLDGTYTEIYSDITEDAEGLQKLFKQFSFPGGIPSHVAPETPGSIHEGGELGYALSHAYGAAFDNPDLLVAAVVGDGEAETGPLATSWHSNKFINPATDGTVLPILHLNGYKIANPTLLDRIPHEELEALMVGYGHKPHFFEAGYDESEEPASFHRRFAELLDTVLDEIDAIKKRAAEGDESRPKWPMIVFRTPKGWTGPATIDGKKTTGSWRAHQVPLASARDTEEHLQDLNTWLQSYRPNELFTEDGQVAEDILSLTPPGTLRMSANPHANGGVLLKELRLPPIEDFAVDVPTPASTISEAPRVLGSYLTEVIRRNPENFRIFGPDETASNRLQGVYDVTDKQWNADFFGPEVDEHMARKGRVVEMLSEHQCQGWLEGYLLTGRHGLMTSYEAFIHIVDSMFNQHAKWLKVTNHIPWRQPIPSLNYLLSSHVWRQDHNGFSHQDPGFIDHVVNKKAEVVRVYLPADANTLLATYEHCLQSRQYVNVVVAGKQPAPNFLSMDQAKAHCERGLGIWEWAGTETPGEDPDVVLACAGDVPTLEVLAAADILRRELPDLKVRVVNVVDLMRLQDEKEHPHGLNDRDFDTIFTRNKPVIFAYHGYPWLIHRLTYRRKGHENIHVRGYKEEGTTTTPFDMVMLNDLDRFHLVIDVIDRVKHLGSTHAGLRQKMEDERIRARAYTREHGQDLPEVRDWVWPDAANQADGDKVQATLDTGGDNE
ncbi:phosphoketolase family protein [Jonesia quinghaiensis]|uniref:phosphoketolase family protein n=1 Tax=Jonesia quinghaiensis TaxID=262806 RepID=UPI000685F6B6|nr:phosphoketolase family protein [Jonesia quinghaiensis]